MKNYFKENKTLVILLVIAAICIITSIILLFKYFYFGNGGSKYGSRLDGIEAVEIKDDRKNSIVSTLEGEDIVETAKMNITGKIIYIKMVFKDSAKLSDAEAVAVKSLDNFSDEEKKFYDFEFTLEQKAAEKTEGFLIMGAKNVNGSNLIWNNNNSTTSDDKE